MKAISNISLTINSSPDSLISFDSDIKEYDVVVPTDCFGILLRLEYAPEFYVSIRSDRDAGRFGFADLDPNMGDYIAGTEIPYYDYYGGYIVRLDKREACFEHDLEVNITIDAGSTEHGTDRYEIHVRRDSGKELRSHFKECMFFDEEYGIEMPYLVYVPSDYDSTKQYPLVTCLHGTGEREEPISSVIKKTQMATAFAKDSEEGLRKCIVLVPKCTIRYDEDDNWTTLNQFVRQRTDSPFYPMPHLTVTWRLIEKIIKEYSVDENRLYLTGISSGAFGAYVLAMDHPRDFAALVAVCGAANPQRIESLKHTPLWIFHAADDPLIVPAYTLDPTLAALDKAGIEYRLTRYPESQVFWQTAHFCWEVAYKNDEMREWMFSQTIDCADNSEEKSDDELEGVKQGHEIDDEVNDIAARAIAAASRIDSI